MTLCPCQSQNDYSACCGRYISGQQYASTPEALMRSRYTAFTQANTDYLERTARGKALERFNPQTAKQWAEAIRWQGLEVLHAPPAKNAKGTVEFKAYYESENKRCLLHEISQFEQHDGCWYYTDGRQPAQSSSPHKTGRNDPCHCGSGKKYKQCCGLKNSTWLAKIAASCQNSILKPTAAKWMSMTPPKWRTFFVHRMA